MRHRAHSFFPLGEISVISSNQPRSVCKRWTARTEDRDLKQTEITILSLVRGKSGKISLGRARFLLGCQTERKKKGREKEGKKEEKRGRMKRIIIDKRVRRRIQFSWFPTGTIARLVFGGESRRLLGIKVGKKFSRGRRDYRRIASTISGDEQRRRKRFRRNIDHTDRYTDSGSRTRSNR